ncbi:MAG TPA: DUF6600 domain-containing protein [Polyangiaceae bacterium]|nr:DUF6600 domain-containing protein [Polyangiaceae bacterium]
MRHVSVLLVLAAVGFAAGARADGPGPAYLIEPGDAPENSVQMVDPADPNAPADVPATDAPGDEGIYDATPAPEPGPPEAPAVADDDPRALGEFGPRLDPYGSWTTDPSYGQVWTPDPAITGDGFSPYVSDGHWAADASGSQVWMSDYPFGDIVFHYGRWVWTTGGWGWVPGYRYAPAWVAWRLPTDAYGYYGWSPLPPSFVWVNRAPVGISWRSSYYWVFCQGAFVHSAAPAQYLVRSPTEAQGIAPHTRAYVPATPHRSSSAPGANQMARAPRPREQQWAPGYRPMNTVRVRPASFDARATNVGAAVAAAPRPRAVSVAHPPPGAAVMHAYTPAPRVMAPAPRMNAGAVPRTFSAGGRRR